MTACGFPSAPPVSDTLLRTLHRRGCNRFQPVKSMISRAPIWLPIALGLLSAPALFAQTSVPAVPPSSAAADPVSTLSPFEVSATQDPGYAGQDTLSGSRLRTNLKDVAAAISPMTAEFLQDIAATNIEGVLEYGVGTRMETDDARAAGPVADGYNDSIRSIRIRGLPGGGRSINFFGAPGEVDLYMTERLEVSRGPNSILYGFGSPAGKINVSSKQALTNKNAYSLSNRLDSWGGERWVADANLAALKEQARRAGRPAPRPRGFVARRRPQRSGSLLRRSQVADRPQDDAQGRVRARRHQALRAAAVFRQRPQVRLGRERPADLQQLRRELRAGHAPAPARRGTPGTPIRDTGATNVVGVQERSGGDWVVVSDRFPAAQNYRQFTYSEAPTGGTAGERLRLWACAIPRPCSRPTGWAAPSEVNNGSAFLAARAARAT